MFQKLLSKLRPKKPFQAYEFKIVDFDVPSEGKLQYAQWLHPGEFGNHITQDRVDFYKALIRRGDFAIDIGANEGDITVPMALAAGKEGLIVAVEANPHVFKVLEQNAKLNPDKTRIVPLNFAATAYDGEFTFGSGDPSYGNGGIVGFTHNKARNVRYTFKVAGKNFDNYLQSNYSADLHRLTLIKIDTEGYDKEILKTLGKTINACRPYLITECFGPATSEEKLELFDVVAGFNYSLYYMAGHYLKDLAPVTRPEMSKGKTFDILAIPKEKIATTPFLK